MLRLLLAAAALTGAACAHSRGEPTALPDGDPSLAVTDAALYQLAAGRAPWTFFANNPGTLNRSPGSGHSEPQLRTQYNARAATQLDATARVRPGASFPDSSIIVKELYAGGRINTVAVMMKLRGSPQASQAGWVWGYFDPTGGVRISVNNRGAACAGCHSSGIDFTRMTDSQLSPQASPSAR
ncbi:MAG: cytochrome P460 family protein [Gemmatimonadaceae bacterium]